mmetsp:Transcript_9361/g.24035  ORF Transcript_9361/g.24035 Transcript_9361/m.24035 type:complete len:243 (+) Transcript_9361:2691-3419(+)
MLVDGAQAHAEGRPSDPAVPDELVDNMPDSVGRHRKADARACPGRRENGRVDADEPARRVQQRPAGVSRVDGSVRLDDAADGSPCHALDVPAHAGHDATRQRLVQPERVAYRVNLLAHAEAVGTSNAQRNKTTARSFSTGLDAEYREILVGLSPDEVCFVGRRGGVRHGDPGALGPADDMEVRHDVAVAVPQEARARALRDLAHVQAEGMRLRQGAARQVHNRRRAPLEHGYRPPLLLEKRR